MEDCDLKVNIDLCIEVEKHPCLYDITRDDHSKRPILERAWAEIGEKIGLSGETCKKRWVNLRTAYIRRKSRPPKSGSGFKKEYYLNKYLQFLIPHLKIAVRLTGSNLPIPNESSPQPSTSSQRQETQHIETNDDGEELASLGIEEDQNARTLLDADQRQEINLYPRQRSTKRSNALSEVDRAFIEYFQAKKKPIVDPEDPRKCFLLSVLPEVHDLTEQQFRSFKRRILDLLDELQSPHLPNIPSNATQEEDVNIPLNDAPPTQETCHELL